MRKFQRDVTAADDRDAPRKLLQVKRIVRGDAAFRAFGRDTAGRITTRGDQQRLGGYTAAGFSELDRMRINNRGTLVEDCDAGLVQHCPIHSGNARNLLVLRGNEARPIKTRFCDCPAETASVREVFGKPAGEHHQFFRNTAAHHASAAEPVLFRNGSASAHLCTDPCRTHAA